MTRLQALTELRDNVKSGDAQPTVFMNALERGGLHGISAFNGSLDAAKALHEAVLPGAVWLVRSSDDEDVRSGRFQQGQFLANIWFHENPNEGGKHFHTWAFTPARAWLLAILEALIAREKE
jgi:hypothetical protein